MDGGLWWDESERLWPLNLNAKCMYCYASQRAVQIQKRALGVLPLPGTKTKVRKTRSNSLIHFTATLICLWLLSTVAFSVSCLERGQGKLKYLPTYSYPIQQSPHNFPHIFLILFFPLLAPKALLLLASDVPTVADKKQHRAISSYFLRSFALFFLSSSSVLPPPASSSPFQCRDTLCLHHAFSTHTYTHVI